MWVPRELLSPALWHVVPFIISLYSPRIIKLESGGLVQFPRFPRHVWMFTELLSNVTVWL